MQQKPLTRDPVNQDSRLLQPCDNFVTTSSQGCNNLESQLTGSQLSGFYCITSRHCQSHSSFFHTVVQIFDQLTSYQYEEGNVASFLITGPPGAGKSSLIAKWYISIMYACSSIIIYYYMHCVIVLPQEQPFGEDLWRQCGHHVAHGDTVLLIVCRTFSDVQKVYTEGKT